MYKFDEELLSLNEKYYDHLLKYVYRSCKLDEKVNNLKELIEMPQIYFDAASKGNPGESCCACVIITDDARHHFTSYLGEMDNHRAEWEALIFSIQHAMELEVGNALIYTDSKLIADSIDKDYVKNPTFKPYFELFKELERQFDLIFVKWIPRAQNKEANQLAQTALRKQLKHK